MTTEVVEQITQTAPEVEVSLEDIYKGAGVTEPQAQTQDVAPVVVAPVEVEIPDAFDEKHKDFIAEMYKEQQVLKQNQQMALAEKAQSAAQIAKAKLEEDVKEAQDYVLKNSGMSDLPYDDSVKQAMAKSMLDEYANKDKRLAMLFANRDKSTEANTAFKKALALVTKEIGKKFEAKVDPALVASRKALKASQQSSATSEIAAEGNSLESLTGNDFDREWAKLRGHY
jgi:hypothetical protein